VSEHSAIGWTNATWNPVTGCSRVSPGCEHCYAETLSLRMGWSKKPWTAQNAVENVKLHPERLREPFRWRDGRLVFVNSMSDLFHPLVPFEFIDEVFAVMALCDRHTFQILTKRPERMAEYLSAPGDGPMSRLPESRVGAATMRLARARGENVDDPNWDIWWTWPLPNVWLGVSCEDQRRADERLPVLLEIPASVRFASFEPLLGPIRFPLPCRESRFWTRLHWAIVGGETGQKHRPMDVRWAEEIASYFTGTALFVKQDSGPRPGKQGRLSDALWARKEYPLCGSTRGENPE